MEVLNYDQLVDSYYENLNTTLRKFSPGPEYLDSWVHDEDHNRSILGIFESAEAYLPELAIEVSQKVAPTINKAWLQETLNKFGNVKVSEKNGGLEVRMTFGNAREVAPKLQKVHPAYQKGLEEASKSLKHQGTINTAEMLEGTHVYGSQDGTTLGIIVDDKKFVVRAKHVGATGLLAGLMDLLCSEILNRPIQEGAEHGLIRVETSLRDASVEPPVKGLITPQNADPIFAIPTKLIRNAFKDYLRLTKSTLGWNDWEDPMGKEWLSLSVENKAALVSKVLPELAALHKLPYTHFEVLTIKNDYRVILVQQNEFNEARVGHDLLVLEKALQNKIEPRLEIVLESLEDKNHRETRTKRDTVFNDRSQNEK